jgi:hypothetical protein
MDNYKLYHFDYIKENQLEIIEDIKKSHSNLIQDGISDSTWKYYLYNIFGVTSPSLHFYHIFKELRRIIFDNVNNDQIWLQSWLNFHNQNEILDWHNHRAPYHGYVCIEPQDTTTEFETGWNIINECGNIYFGEGNIQHRVVNNSSYSGKRITLGYDVVTEECLNDYSPTQNYGLIPLL